MNDPSFEDDPRPRVARRLRLAAEYRIVVLLAAAGFGKSIALRQFLETIEGSARVDVTPGMKAADFAAHLSAALNAGAGATVAIDGLEGLAEPGQAVANLVESIERTKAQTRWVISTRSAVGLPLGSWTAYRDCELVIGAADLQYARDEIVDAGLRLGFGLGDEELDDIATLTEGWPLAVGVALRAALHGHGRDRLQGEVREAASRLFLETVYPQLTAEERSLLAVAAALPEVDVRIVELAGFARANETLEKLRERTALLADGPDGTYHCLGLFRSFLRRQIEIGGSGEIGRVYLSAARGLEAAGRVNDALDAFISAKAQSEVLRLLERSGFDLLERGQSSAIGRAVDVLSEADRRLNPHVLALRGVLQSLAGDVISAEALLRRALSRAEGLPSLTSAVSIRLALILTNQGREIDELLGPVANDVARSVADRAEAWSLMAARSALAGSTAAARASMSEVECLLDEVESESTRARILQRIGVAAVYIGDLDRSRSALSQAASLAMELDLFSLASRAYANLSNVMLHHLDDVAAQLHYAELAFDAAVRAADAFDIETASLQLLDADLRLGASARVDDLERRIAGARSEDRSRTHYLTPSKALRLAWEGRFAEAHRVLGPSWSRLHHDLDKAVTGAQQALYLALDDKRVPSTGTTAQVLDLLGVVETHGPFSVRCVAVARLCCALAEALNGRRTRADSIVRLISADDGDAVVELLRETGERMLACVRRRNRSDPDTLTTLTDQLDTLGYGHVARLLQVVSEFVEQRKPAASGVLSPTECGVLTLIADGLSPKEIASRRGSTVNTVRKHIARSIIKLRCNGRGEAVALAKRLGLLTAAGPGGYG